MPHSRSQCERRILIASGYFDWFSGYQEVGLARALRAMGAVHVLAGDRISPIFTDAHLKQLGLTRRYTPGTKIENGVVIRRLATVEMRSMLWSWDAISAVRTGDFDHVIQVMPGQILPMAATIPGRGASRTVLYGDNAAMYAGMSPVAAALKFAAFTVTKGSLYRLANSRADRLFGYTPATIARLKRFSAGRSMELLPLAFDERVFFVDSKGRQEARQELGYSQNDFVMIAPGKIRAQKRFDLLVRLTLELRAADVPAKLLLVGVDDGPDSRMLLSQISRSGAADCVTALPFAPPDRLNLLMNAADLGVWPTMPAMTIQQAMGTGLRVLIPNNDLVGHLLTSEHVGRYFDPTPETLESAVMRALRHEAAHAHRHSSESCRRERREHNSWLSTEHVAKRLVEPTLGSHHPSV